MARYHGRNGVVYMSTTGTGTAVNVIALNAWNIDFSTDVVEVTSFGDTNKQYVQGLKDVQGTVSGFWDDTTESLFAAADSSDGVKVYLYPSSAAAARYFYGPAWIDASMDTGVADAVKISCNLRANGNWGRRMS